MHACEKDQVKRRLFIGTRNKRERRGKERSGNDVMKLIGRYLSRKERNTSRWEGKSERENK